MPWDDNTNENSGGNGGPWGRGPQGQGPWGGGGQGGGQGGGPRGPRRPGGPGGPGGPQGPDLDEVIRQAQDRFNQMFGGGKGFSGRLILLVLGVLIGLWLLTGFYRVNADEQGVVLRFGKFVETTQPGLNYHLPYPIESAVTPKTEAVNRINVGFVPATNGPRDLSEESLMLTGDENIVDIDFSVLWKISNAGDYLFNLQEPERVMKAVAESVMREVIGQNQIALILTEGRGQIQSEVRLAMQTVLDEYGAGVLISEVQLQKVDPPSDVIDAFRDVQRAQADAEKERNQADAYARDIVPRARGEAQQIIEAARGYKDRAIATAEGEAARFLSIYEEYQNAKDIVRKRIFLETMEKVLGDMDKIIIDGEGAGVVPYLPLDQLRKKDNR